MGMTARVRNYQLCILAAGLLAVPLLGSRRTDSTPPERSVDATDPRIVSRSGVLYLADAPLNGLVIERWPDGSTKSITEFAAGRRHGAATAWYPDGQPMYERWYEEGLEEGTHRGWWEDGSRRFEYDFDRGLHDGTAREWYADGSLYREFQYAEGQEVGRQRMWYADGTLRANYVVREGRRFGLIGSKGCTGGEGDPKERIS